MIAPISISYSSDNVKEDAEIFSERSGYPIDISPLVKSTFTLNYTDDFVELVDNEKNINIHIDFLSGDLAHRQQYGGGRGQTIAKAIGLKQGIAPPSVLDATAGLAKDAFVLACLGCSLTLVERSTIIAELIRDAINRAKDNTPFQNIIKKGFNLIEASSIEYLTQLANNNKIKHPDVVYLDPMYPEKKKSASVKKNMQILQTLLGKDEDIKELLNAALKVAKKRVVVKRPKGASSLSKIKPTYEISSKNTRYDVYITPKS